MKNNGFPTNSMHGIVEDDNGNLWISTTKGISKFNPETNHVKNYDASYGIRSACRCLLMDDGL